MAVRLLEIEREDLVKVAIDILRGSPSIPPLALFDKAQQKVLDSDRRRDLKHLKKNPKLFRWLYDEVVKTTKSSVQPIVTHQSGAAKNLAMSVSLDKIFGSKLGSKDKDLIQEFVNQAVAGPEDTGRSKEWEVQVESRLQAIEGLLGTLMEAMRQAVTQKKPSKSS